MKGYLQDLDTVNFNPDTHVGELRGLFREAKIRTALYNVVYEVTLAPNQVLDLAWLRDDYANVSPKVWPFIFTVDSTLIESRTPFTKQLLLFLRRSGNQAFVFSSMPRNVELAKKWGEFLETEGHMMADEPLLAEASNYYGEIVAWAKRLDALSGDIVIRPYGQGPKYSELYGDYLTALGLPYLDPPQTRSEAYSKISLLPDVDLQAQFDTLKSIPDLVSNVQYAINTQSRLILGSESVLEHKIELPETKEFVADIILDLNGLLSRYSEIEDAIASSSAEKISEALSKARKYVQQGWSLLDIRDVSGAKRKLGAGLKVFARELAQKDMPSFPVRIILEPSFIAGKPPTFKVEIPPINVAVYLRWFVKWKLRGLDKFINIRKAGE